MYHLKRITLSLSILLSLFLFFGCLGSSSGDKDNIKNDVSLSGYVTNGPLSGATVTVYDSDDFSAGSAPTNSEGYFLIDGLPESSSYLVIAEGGSLDGQAYPGVLKGFCTASPCNLGAGIVA